MSEGPPGFKWLPEPIDMMEISLLNQDIRYWFLVVSWAHEERLFQPLNRTASAFGPQQR